MAKQKTKVVKDENVGAHIQGQMDKSRSAVIKKSARAHKG